MAQKQFPIESPLGGVNRVVNREGQPSSTCWDALNVLPFDVYGRRRIAQRFGVNEMFTKSLGSTIVQGMLPVNLILYPVNINSTGVVFYTETFTDINAFAAIWNNVPSTWAVGGSTLLIPPGGAGTVSLAGGDGGNQGLPEFPSPFSLTYSVKFTTTGSTAAGRVTVTFINSVDSQVAEGTRGAAASFTFTKGIGGAGWNLILQDLGDPSRSITNTGVDDLTSTTLTFSFGVDQTVPQATWGGIATPNATLLRTNPAFLVSTPIIQLTVDQLGSTTTAHVG